MTARKLLLMKCLILYLAATILLSFKSLSQESPAQLKLALAAAKSYTDKIAAYIQYNDKYGVQNFDDMLRYGFEGFALARSNGDSFSLAVLHRQVGEAYYFKGLYDSAASHYYSSINLLEKGAASKQLANSYNALAKLYRKTRDLTRSLQNYDKAFSIFTQLNDSAGMATIWNESGVVFEYSNDYKTAIARYKASLAIDEALKDEQGIAYALSNIAGVYILEENYLQAEAYLLKALAVRKKVKDTFALALNYSDLGAAYMASGNYSQAKKCIDTSTSIARNMGYPELQQTNFDMLAQMAEKTGDYKSAYLFSNLKVAIKDSIYNLKKTKQIEELNSKYETVKKEKQITDQQHRLQQQKFISIAIIVLAFLLLLLAFAQYRRYKWKQEARLQLAITRQQELATKAVLEAEETERQRIAKDLHDGVGQMMSAAKMNLSAYEYATKFVSADEKLNFEKIIQLVDESCNEVRSVSHNMMPNALMKNSLAAAIREFINKLDSRNLAAHLYTEGLEERLDINTETVLYRIVQECVNNVIKHAGATTLDISIIKEKDAIAVTVEDNGKGFDVIDKQKNGGIGMKNIVTRIAYLKGTVDFDSAPGKGTLVALHVPLATVNT